MDILGPDAGTIEILGQPADHAARDRIGYMPEERGLYPRMVLEEQLVFMAAIKGVPAKEAQKRMGPWLERLSLADWRKRKTNELSKGMQQKAQFIATVLHQPEVLIVDEPLSGLDPVGDGRDARGDPRPAPRGHHDRAVEPPDGDGREAVRPRGAHQPRREDPRRRGLRGEGPPRQEHRGARLRGRRLLHRVAARGRQGHRLRPVPGGAARRPAHDPQPLLREAAARLKLRRFEIVEPSLHDIFVETVTSHGKEAA